MSNKLVCPNCQKAHELKDYITATDSEMAFKIALTVPPQISNLVLKYSQLFAPAKSAMSLERRAKIIESMQLEGCDVGRVAFGINTMLETHANGNLKTPLKNHNYLKKVMTSYIPPDVAEEKKYKLSEGQIKFIAVRLCNNDKFAMNHANIGESAGEFMMRIENELHNVETVKQWYGYIETIKQQTNR
ncbi:MAG: hypothetical protein KGV51_03470 [Moraxellaceae bacterium]|nr:hypothetical protein [Moraxellaceae bacterium]